MKEDKNKTLYYIEEQTYYDDRGFLYTDTKNGFETVKTKQLNIWEKVISKIKKFLSNND